MVEIIAGEHGKGKSKYLLDKANNSIAAASGNIIFIDKSGKHMYELTNKIRLVNVSDYPITGKDEAMGFLCGIIAADHDIQEIYIDSFLDVAFATDESLITDSISKLDVISEKFGVRFVVSIAMDEDKLPECAKAKLIVSL